MAKKIDFKKRDKVLYAPPTTPVVVDVPEMNFIVVEGAGDPNDAAFQSAIEVLYTLSYIIKMSPKAGMNIDGYYDYAVAPLEGQWDGGSAREDWTWVAMIRQPEFVTNNVFVWALEKAKTKKPDLDMSGARLQKITEGKCVQVMHLGPFATEQGSFDKMDEFRAAHGLELLGNVHHREIYLSDFRKVAPEKLKTVLRQQLR